MDFTITQDITKELLFQSLTEEQIFCNYLHLSQIPRKLILSPVREDRSPTCGFYRNSNGVLILHDFATGEYMNCFNLVMKMYNCSYHQALKIIANDFHIQASAKSAIVPKRQTPVFIQQEKNTQIQVELDNFSDKELDWWKQFGVSQSTLQKYKVFSVKTVFLNGNIFCRKAQHNPIYGYYFGKKGGLEQWKIYMPQSKLRFIGNISQKTIQGYKQLPKSGKLLIINKSMKDVCALAEYNIPAIAPQSETTFIQPHILDDLRERFKHIVVWFDTDIPGINAMRKLKKLYPDLHYFFIPRKYNAKDFSDFIKLHGRAEGKQLLWSIIDRVKETI